MPEIVKPESLLWPDQIAPIIQPAPSIIIPKAKDLPNSAELVTVGSLVIPKGRDAGVQALVDHLNAESQRYVADGSWDRMSTDERFQILGSAERKAVMEQVRSCREDFTYAARNYFWITDNNGQDKLFTLWETQWLMLQKWHELKRRGRAQKIMILKARQLGISVLCEAMIAWRTMFFRNTAAIVVAGDEEQSAYLYGIMLHIYDKMPWWLKPEAATLEVKGGLHFDRADRDQRERNPGLNSHIYVQHANQMSGVGQGKRLSACHCSEYSDWQEKRAKEIIEGDLLHSIHDEDPNSFGFLESTGRGAGSYSHKLWKNNVERGEDAEWYPLFLPFFLDTTKSRPVPSGWSLNRPDLKPERMLKARVREEWVRCDKCGQHQAAKFGGRDRRGEQCPACDAGTLRPAEISDETLRWKEVKRKNAAKDAESAKLHEQETASTAEEAWQLSGYAVFDELCQDAMSMTVRDPLTNVNVRVGFMDSKRRFHGVKFEKMGADRKVVVRGCFVDGCEADHSTPMLYEEESNFIVWEMPQAKATYSVGVDISEGFDQDYSVIAVNKIGKAGSPDEQVAVWRSNQVEPIDVAFFADAIGRMYNEALMCIEYNFAKIVGNMVRIDFQYPNLFRWKHLDSKDPMSQKFHWITQQNTKPLLWQTARKWIKAGYFIVRSPNFQEETKAFQKDEDDSKSASAIRGSHDDELIATCIALYCAHEYEADDSGRVSPPLAVAEVEPPRYKMTCTKCGTEWGAARPDTEFRCPIDTCGSIYLKGEPLETPDPRSMLDLDALLGAGTKAGVAPESIGSMRDYDSRALRSTRPQGLSDGGRREDPKESREAYWGK